MTVRMIRAADRRAEIPGHLRSWLFDPRSLSRRLSRACPGGFRVRLIAQGWHAPLTSERRALCLPLRERALIREVLLLCHDTPWVYARSVFPAHTLRGAQRRLAHLGTRPLGRVLFATRGMRRTAVTVSAAQGDGDMLACCSAALGRIPQHAWKRTSVFRCRGRTLLVSEVFLEAFARD
jgi:chorismate--pyruvate lyase